MVILLTGCSKEYSARIGTGNRKLVNDTPRVRVTYTNKNGKDTYVYYRPEFEKRGSDYISYWIVSTDDENYEVVK